MFILQVVNVEKKGAILKLPFLLDGGSYLNERSKNTLFIYRILLAFGRFSSIISPFTIK
jgi:hypothetical protein